MKISFIVLHYNQSEYIKESLYSIIYSGLTNEELEIIILDDFSSLEEYTKLNKQVEEIKNNYNISIYIYKENKNTKNQSLLRNKGIEKSSGDYIVFLDGDDFINSISFKKMYEFIKKNNYDVYFPTRIIGWNTYGNKSYNKITVDIDDENSYGCGISHYIIKKETLYKHNIFFEEKEFNFYAEDIYFFCLLIDSIKKYNISCYTYYDDWYYCGLKRPTSTFANKNSNIVSKTYWTKYSKFLIKKIEDKKVLQYGLNNIIKLFKYQNR